jgi:hypothetical protein
MTVADRWEGETVGTCGCGSALVWERDAQGEWHAAHADEELAVACSNATDTPSDEETAESTTT